MRLENKGVRNQEGAANMKPKNSYDALYIEIKGDAWPTNWTRADIDGAIIQKHFHRAHGISSSTGIYNEVIRSAFPDAIGGSYEADGSARVKYSDNSEEVISAELLHAMVIAHIKGA